MPGMEPVVTHYQQSVEAMKKQLSPDPISRDHLLNGAKDRLTPFSYSLDIAWQQRIQSFTDTVINDPTRGGVEGPDKNLVEALRKLERTGISDRLQDWLIEADPFKKNHDEAAIAARGEKLLTSIETCFKIAAERSETQQLQPDLTAIADWASMRMNGFVNGVPPRSPADSVPHKMYLELRDAIGRSIDGVREKVEKSGGDVAEWDNGLTEKKQKLARTSPNHPFWLWSSTCRDVLPRSNTVLLGRQHLLETLFASREFENQISTLYKAINGDRDAKSYAMKVREAAWPVHETIDHYLGGIEGLWGRGEEDLRESLNQGLCAVADRVLKEVNFVITANARRWKGDQGG
jgi:hypothetical protein